MDKIPEKDKLNASKGKLIATLNNTGFMISTLDPFSRAFVDYAKETKGNVLDVGAAYGVATLPALAGGARVTAVDPEIQHLKILEQNVNTADKKNLQLCKAILPNVDFEENSFDAILCSRVLHFLNGEDITKSMQLFHRWLKPNGRLYLMNETPYCYVWKAVIPLYEARKLTGHAWPAMMENFPAYMSEDSDKSVAPAFFNPIDLWQLEKITTEANFTVQTSSYISRDIPGISYDGRESAGLIALKE